MQNLVLRHNLLLRAINPCVGAIRSYMSMTDHIRRGLSNSNEQLWSQMPSAGASTQDADKALAQKLQLERIRGLVHELQGQSQSPASGGALCAAQYDTVSSVPRQRGPRR